jgi:hypothetical protein
VTRHDSEETDTAVLVDPDPEEPADSSSVAGVFRSAVARFKSAGGRLLWPTAVAWRERAHGGVKGLEGIEHQAGAHAGNINAKSIS